MSWARVGTARAWILAALLVPLSGCAGDETKPPAGPANVGEVVPFLEAPWSPLIINETENGHTFEIHIRPRITCPFDNARLHSTVSLYDRYGKQYEREIDFEYYPMREPEVYEFVLQGAPPYLVAGDSIACVSVRSSFNNVTDGFQPTSVAANAINMNALLVDYQVDVPVAIGDLGNEVTWTPGEFVYMFEEIHPSFDDFTGAFYGNLSVADAQGTVTRWDRFSYISGHELWYDPVKRVPGTYTVTLELETPATEPTNWPYTFETRSLTPAYCVYGFEWEICS